MSQDKTPTVVHVITSLGDGGAEGALFRLVTNDFAARHVVISLMCDGKYNSLLKEQNIKVHSLGMRRGRAKFSDISRLRELLIEINPDAAQTWMYHSDLIGGIAARVAGISNITWGIRHSTFSSAGGTGTASLVARLCGVLSRVIPKNIVTVSEAGIEPHKRMHYDTRKFTVIHNGYSFEEYRPDKSMRAAFRLELGVDPKTPLLGFVARYNKQKDHSTLLQGLRLVKQSGVPFQLVLVGSGMEETNAELRELIQSNGLERETILLGPRADVPVVMNGLDIHLMSSAFGEGFPNVLAEAMACGTPCITTDVGDASVIVDGFGWVIPPSSPDDLAAAVQDAIQELTTSPKDFVKRKTDGEQHIRSHFSIQNMIASFHSVWFG